MSDEPPTPPSTLPSDAVDTLEEHSPKVLRHVAQYTEELATYRECEA